MVVSITGSDKVGVVFKKYTNVSNIICFVIIFVMYCNTERYLTESQSRTPKLSYTQVHV